MNTADSFVCYITWSIQTLLLIQGQGNDFLGYGNARILNNMNYVFHAIFGLH